MNKYKNILSTIGHILGFSIFALISIVLTALPIVVLITQDLIGMIILLEFCLFCSVHIISYAVGLFFLGDHYKPTGYVSGGKSLNWPVETFRYVKRNMITNFLEVIFCLIFSVVYIVLLCTKLSVTISICGLVMSIIGFVIFFLFFKKQQFTLKEKQK